MTDLTVLRTVALKGRIDAKGIADTTGEADVAIVASGLAELGLLKAIPAGFRMTPEGRERLAQLIAGERAGIDSAAVARIYEDFTTLNAEAKEVFTRWQVRDGSPNEHTDADYDAGVLGDLDDIHERILPLVEQVAALVPRAGRYGERLASAQAKYAAGDLAWVTRPIIDSYHTVWFELHEDLIAWAGLTRADEAAAGRAH